MGLSGHPGCRTDVQPSEAAAPARDEGVRPATRPLHLRRAAPVGLGSRDKQFSAITRHVPAARKPRGDPRKLDVRQSAAVGLQVDRCSHCDRLLCPQRLLKG